MNCWITVVLAAASLHAAVIRGTVVNHDGGEPLSQTEVVLKAIQGGATLNARTDSFGLFMFPSVPAGAYLLSATRPFFVPAYYGQKRWNSAGLPLVLEENASPTLSIRMHRYGGVTGRVVDENDVGILGHEVLAYRQGQATQIVTRATTDDYGRYRLYGLTPGMYLVRSAPKKVDGLGYIPTWAPGVQEIDQARRVEVLLDIDTPGIEVRPDQGQLFDIAGEYADLIATQLTLAGETGRQTVNVAGALVGPTPFRFNPVPPGHYELYAESPDGDCPRSNLRSVYIPLSVTEDRTNLNVSMSCVEETRITYSLQNGGNIPDPQSLLLRARRIDLAGIAKEVNLGRGPSTVGLGFGRWEFLLQPTTAYAVTGVSPSNTPVRLRSHADGWTEIQAGDRNRPIRYYLTNNPCSVRGVVTGTDHEPVMGAPVYLEGWDPAQKSRVGELRTAITDSRGNYQFDGLASSSYRILATFEYTAPDPSVMEDSGAKTVSLNRPGISGTQDLDLFVLR